MASQALASHYILQSSGDLPPVGPNPLTDRQWDTLLSLADVVFPAVLLEEIASEKHGQACLLPRSEYAQLRQSIRASVRSNKIPEAELEELIDRYLSERPSQNRKFRDYVWTTMNTNVSPQKKEELIFLLNMLDSKVGNILMSGKSTPFSQLSYKQRRDIMIAWNTARLPMFRSITSGFTLLFSINFCWTSPTLPRILAIPATPVHGQVGEDHPFEFVNPTASPNNTLDADVVIVGSGCGGAVAAANLSAAGLRVLLVEKGRFIKHSDFPVTGREGTNKIFEAGGPVTSDEGDMAMLAGSVWGGGGTVNWSASLQTEGHVRAEWARISGVRWFESAAFRLSLDRVCDRMGVSDKYVKHNFANQVLIDGARKLGWAHKVVPQNTGGCVHFCGSCSFGCRSGEKRGTLETWLPDAARNGTRFLQNFTATRILFGKAGKVAAGVEGTWLPEGATEEQAQVVTIRARRVIVSGGSLWSPVLLQKSGVKNSHVGKHLKLHPVASAHAVFDHETRPWEGPILTSLVSEFANLDGKGHGVKLEALNMMPEVSLQTLPWFKCQNPGVDIKAMAIKYRRTSSFIALTRDISEGRIYPDPVTGRVRLSYPVLPIDRRHCAEGVVAIAKILHTMGAREIFSSLVGGPRWIRKGKIPRHTRISQQVWTEYPMPDRADDCPGYEGIKYVDDEPLDGAGQAGTHGYGRDSLDGDSLDEQENDRTWADFLAALRDGVANSGGDLTFMSAHQMGSCRMSARPGDGVVDPRGYVWGHKNLLVMDASVFPSASGVNPMISCMAIVDLLSRRLAAEMLGEGAVYQRERL